MNLQSAFNNLLQENTIDLESVNATIKALVRKLNSVYYGISDDNKNYFLAGSIGRKTAVCFSDIDFCYVLPQNVYERFSNRTGSNIQSQLLCEIKNKVEERYPNSEIKADGQVVDAKFKNRLVELVPSFKPNSFDDSLTYPDSHSNGSWLITNPTKQKEESDAFCNSYPLYRDLCKILRCWRVECNARIKGIQIDILVMDFLKNRIDFYGKHLRDVDSIKTLCVLFEYLSEFQSRNMKIPGESNLIYVDSSRFKKKAKKAFNRLSVSNSSELWDNCIKLFGDGFPKNPFDSSYTSNEQFIQQLYPLKLKYNLKIDCIIKCNGYRDKSLLDLLQNDFLGSRYVVERSRKLIFKIVECDVPKPYEIYWKIRNVGKEAISRNNVRGNIFRGEKTREENSQFHGPHYTECFIVKDGKCVAKDKLEVPIE